MNLKKAPHQTSKILRDQLLSLDTDSLLATLNDASLLDDSAWEQARRDPRAWLHSRGLELPLDIQLLFEQRPIPEPSPLDFERLGIIGWRCFKWCKVSVDLDEKPMMRCYDVCLPMFK